MAEENQKLSKAIQVSVGIIEAGVAKLLAQTAITGVEVDMNPPTPRKP